MRPLPHNREAEAAVLAGVLLRNDVLDDVRVLVNEDDFHVPAHRVVWRAMLRLAEKGQPIDPVTLESQIRSTNELGLVGGLEGLGKLSDRYASSHHVANHAKLVADVAAQRRLVVAAREVLDEGMEIQQDVRAWIDSVQQRVMQVSVTAANAKSYAHIKDLLPREFELTASQAKAAALAVESGRPIPLTGVRTGYERLDQMLCGAQPSDLIILAARPSMGKTAFAMNIAENVASDGEPVLAFSMEMSGGQLTRRMMFSNGRLDAKKFRSGELFEGDMINLVRACERLVKLPVAIDDRGGLSIREVRATARRWRKDPVYFPNDGRKRRGLIVVDYLQLGAGEEGSENRNIEVGQITKGLKNIAKELELPVLALSQLNRGVDARPNKRPLMSDLRESGNIEQDADVVLFIYRRAVYMTEETPEQATEKLAAQRDAEIIIGKNRNGEIGSVHLVWMGEHTRFENPDYHR